MTSSEGADHFLKMVIYIKQVSFKIQGNILNHVKKGKLKPKQEQKVLIQLLFGMKSEQIRIWLKKKNSVPENFYQLIIRTKYYR